MSTNTEVAAVLPKIVFILKTPNNNGVFVGSFPEKQITLIVELLKDAVFKPKLKRNILRV